MEQLYKQLYFYLFNKVSDSIELLRSGEAEKATEMLISAQQAAEDMYINKAADQRPVCV